MSSELMKNYHTMSVCLINRAGQGQGRAGQGGQTFSVTGRYLSGRYLLAAPIRNRAGQGRAGRYLPRRYLLAAPIRNKVGQGRAVIFIIEHIKKTRIFLNKKKENKYINK